MSGAKILVVEDEWLVAQGVSENLQDLGYEVTGLASSGAEALSLVEKSRTDLVLMDIQLQGDMDGIEAAEVLRRKFNLPVVFLTAYADSHTLARAKVTEPFGYLLKPFEVRELHSAIEIALYKSGAEKRLQHLTEVLRAIRNVNQLIVQEKDRPQLIRKATRLLTEGRGYFNAWIALMPGDQITDFAMAGEDGDTGCLRQSLEQGMMPRCAQLVMQERNLLILEDLSAPSGCHLWGNYQDRGALVTPLMHQHYFYGVLGVLLPLSLSRDEEELSLFKEVAADLSLALYKLDLEDRELQAQADLRASEEKFRLLFDKAPLGYQSLDEHGCIQAVNRKWLDILGYAEEEVLGKWFGDFNTPEYRQGFSGRFSQFLGLGEINDVEIDLVKKDGSIITASFTGRTVFDESGRLFRTHCVFSDITARLQFEREMLQLSQFNREIIEGAGEGVIVYDRQCRYKVWNKFMERLTGISAAEVINREAFQVFPHLKEQGVDELLYRTLCGETVTSGDLPFFIPETGRRGWVVATFAPHRNICGEIIGVIGTVQDVTLRKQAEKDLKEGARLHQLLLDSLPCVAMLIRPHTREIVTANATAALAGAIPGKPCYTTWARRQDPCPFCLAPLVWENQQDQHLEVEYNGTCWDAHWIPIRNDLILHYAFDISARKEAERARKKLEAQLTQTQKMEALGTLAGGIAHDFNNILGAMIGFAELAALNIPEGSEVKYYLDNLLKAGDRARYMVKQILSFSRQETTDRRPINIAPIIKDTLKFLRASLPTTIEIRASLKAKKNMIVADPTQIHQVLLNLATNAAHAMTENGGVMEINLEILQLSPEESSFYEGIAPGPYLELEVSDTGCGMGPEVLPRIFDPFFTTKEPGEGTGMGLAVVYGIVKDHGGVIRVASEPGRGTAFRLLLPTVQVIQAEDAPETSPVISKGSGRILFVDDDADFFRAGQLMLTGLGYEVTAHAHSLKALEEFRAAPQSFDLLICDQTMPDLTGLELAAACSHLRPDLPIILCTGFSETVTPEKTRAAGIREVMTKPFSLNQLGEAIKKAHPKPEV